MLPSNIDLTERADFGSPSSMSMDTPVDLDLDDSDSGNKMSSNEYNSLIRWESIFGKRRHINQKWNIFPRNGLNVSYGSENPYTLYCSRCGKVIRIPWKNYGYHYPWKNYGLCFECSEKVETEIWGKIPWKHTSTSSRNDERGYNLFNSK